MHVSKIPLLFQCPSSALPCEHPYDAPSDAGNLGQAVHVSLGEMVMGRTPDFGAIAKRFDCAERDLRALHFFGTLAWAEIASYFPAPQIEQQLSAGELRGRVDVIHRDDDNICILDWKTSRQRSNVRPQLHGYACCADDSYGMPRSGCIRVFTVWLRLGQVDLATMRHVDLDGFREDFANAKRRIGKQFSPGEACTFCPRQLVCEARRDYVRTSADALAVVGAGAVPTQRTLLALYPRAKTLENALQQYRKAMRMYLRETGPVSDEQGNTYELQETKRENIDARKAWPVLVGQGFSDDELAQCVSMSTTPVMDCAAARAPRGRKKAAKDSLRALLRERGCMSESIVESIKVSKGGRS